VSATSNTGDQQVMTLHYDLQVPTGQLANDPQSLANFFRDHVSPAAQGLFRPEWTINPVIVTDEKDPLNPTAPRQQWTAGVPLAGTRGTSTDLLPSGCCGLAKLNTDHIGRRFTGRVFIFGQLAEGDQSAGIINNGTLLTSMKGLMDAIPVQPDISPPGSTATANWCVYSRTQRAANLNPYAAHVTSYTLRNRVHFLRRRSEYA
jgi:hypothetical protein